MDTYKKQYATALLLEEYRLKSIIKDLKAQIGNLELDYTKMEISKTICGNKTAHVICETCFNKAYYVRNPYCPFRCGTEGVSKRNVRTEALKLHW